MDPSRSSPEELLSHAQWLRMLALRMVGDESTADDLVQETWLAALKRPPRSEGLRAWLSRVLTNAVRQRRRSTLRREGYEVEAPAQRAEVPSPEDLALRLEQEQRLLAAVGGLRDPYRTVVLLRYEEGLSAVEIAKLRGLPAATVRTQLHRALEALRRSMDEAAGGREAWALLLAPGVNLSKVKTAVAAAEVIGMSGASKIGLAGAAVVLALWGAWSVGGPGQEREAPLSVTPKSEVAESSDAVEASDSNRDWVAGASAGPQRSAAAGAEGREAEQHVFEARIVNAKGTPVEGAAVLWSEGEVESTPSSADGQVELTVERTAFGERGTVRVQAAGFLPLEIEFAPGSGNRTLLGDVTLVGGATLTGVVLDAAGLPVTGQRVVLSWARSLDGRMARVRRKGPSLTDLWDGAEETRTDDQGRFELHSFETGTRMLWAGAPEYLWTIEGPFEIAAGDSRDLLLTLEPAARELRISGLVLDPEAQPVADAHLWFFDDTGRGKRSSKTDSEGRFDLLLEVDRPHQLRALDPQKRFPEVGLYDVAPGSTDVVLRFVETRQLAFVALDSTGTPIQIDSLYATNRADDNIIATSKKAESAEQGGSLLEPSETFHVKIQAPAHDEGVFGPFEPGVLPVRSEFRLEAVQQVTGVVRHEGRPLPDAAVEVYWSIGSGQVVYNRGFRALRYPFSHQRTTTDSEGRFALTPRDQPDFILRVAAEGLAPAEEEVRGYDPKEGLQLEFDLTAGAAMHGVVRARAGEEPTGLIVAASRCDANEHTMRVGPDGLFRFENLMPGDWWVEVLTDDMSEAGATFQSARNAPDPEWNVELKEGEDQLVELDLNQAERALLDGSLNIDGQPAAGWTAALRPAHRPSGRPSEFPQTVLDVGGQFHLETPVMGQQTLTLSSPPDQLSLALRASLELIDGQRNWSLSLQTGTLELSGVPIVAHEHFRPHLRWQGAEGMSARIELMPDANGRVRLEGLPAGALEFIAHPEGPGTAAVVLRTVELSPAQELVQTW